MNYLVQSPLLVELETEAQARKSLAKTHRLITAKLGQEQRVLVCV